MLGIVRGGVPAAVEVGRALGVPVDVLLIRRLLLPRGPHDLVCAVSAAGTLVLDDEAAEIQSSDPAAAAFVESALAAFGERVALCRGTAPAAPLEGRTVLLVDNGVHTGGTLRIAIRALRGLRPARIVAAVPVAAAGARAEMEALADEVVCLAWPEALANVAQAYAAFRVPAVEDVAALLREAPRMEGGA
ncbi:MAG TPA: phosphoribosyltransferase family protein [Longimicrobium sp.]|nr:phosphoribosyltransferase family protein [Longimicrobium sp.]